MFPMAAYGLNDILHESSLFLLLRWKHKLGEFKQVTFKETMIDHLEIESRIIFAESKEGREQIKKYGRDVENNGKFFFENKDYCNMFLQTWWKKKNLDLMMRPMKKLKRIQRKQINLHSLREPPRQSSLISKTQSVKLTLRQCKLIW